MTHLQTSRQLWSKCADRYPAHYKRIVAWAAEEAAWAAWEESVRNAAGNPGAEQEEASSYLEVDAGALTDALRALGA